MHRVIIIIIILVITCLYVLYFNFKKMNWQNLNGKTADVPQMKDFLKVDT